MSIFDRVKRLFGSSAIGGAATGSSLSLIGHKASSGGFHFQFKDSDAINLERLVEKNHRESLALAALISDQYATEQDSSIYLSWDNFYLMLEDEELDGVLDVLDLPRPTPLHLVLTEKGSVSDVNFQVFIHTFRYRSREHPINPETPIQRVGSERLILDRTNWELLKVVSTHNLEGDIERTQDQNERFWGEARHHAISAKADLSPYLQNTVVLLKEKLQLKYRKQVVGDTTVIEVEPTFMDAPSEWIHTFDSFKSVPEHYDFSTGVGRTRVILSEPVRQILRTIKVQFPARRVAGSHAEQFVRNPFAMLGVEAEEALDEEQVEKEREDIGVGSTNFILRPRVEKNRVVEVDLNIDSVDADGSRNFKRYQIKTPEDLLGVIEQIQTALNEQVEFFTLNNHVIDIDGETESKIELARRWVSIWEEQAQRQINFDDIYELKNYSPRVEGIGITKPIYSAYIQKTGDGETSWLPENLTPVVGVRLTPDQPPVLIPMTQQWLDQLRESVKSAEAKGRETIIDARLPRPISVPEAKDLVDRLYQLLGKEDEESNRGDGTNTSGRQDAGGAADAKKTTTPERLLLRQNIVNLDYSETQNELAARASALTPPENHRAVLPKQLKSHIKLKPHQIENLARMQFLYSLGIEDCKGVLLADDMGLGKTLQLLSLLSWFYERNPNAEPSLIVAPPPLLENWDDEAKKFFDDFPEILVLHDKELEYRRQPLEMIDPALRQKQILKLLAPDWVGAAKVVITNYETLRNYEFSFAKQQFHFMICDEAQKIKSPNALVTTACKKQKTRFRIACTGTPVENSLTDIWCLFDFVQPGLLGALNEFGKLYRRPIECRKEGDEKGLAQLEELRDLITPQVLRKTKEDIKKDLPKKEIVSNDEYHLAGKTRGRLRVPMSQYQYSLYSRGLGQRRNSSEEPDAKERARINFGVLNLLRNICAEPHVTSIGRRDDCAFGDPVHLQESPKAQWLMDSLAQIQQVGEKAIIFTDRKDIQQALVSLIKRTFGLMPKVINGDSDQRKKEIDKFQFAEGFNVIILSPLAVGYGLNITGANNVIHYTRTWNPARENQATDRAYRIGQTRDVKVYCPTIVHSEFVTFEDKLDRLMSVKADLAGDMLDGVGGDVSGADLMPEDGDWGSDNGGVQHLKIEDVDVLNGETFEIFSQLLFMEGGYDAFVTDKKQGDGGIDVIGIRPGEGVMVQCKHTNQDSIGWDALKEVFTGEKLHQRKYPGVIFKKIAITNRQFNATARERANELDIEIWDRDKIESELGTLQISDSRFLDLLRARGLN